MNAEGFQAIRDAIESAKEIDPPDTLRLDPCPSCHNKAPTVSEGRRGKRFYLTDGCPHSLQVFGPYAAQEDAELGWERKRTELAGTPSEPADIPFE